jgi:hypothetical protein
MTAKKERTHEELRAIEVSRRAALERGSGVGVGYTSYSIMFYAYRGTIFHYLLIDPLFWVTMGSFLFVRLFDGLYNAAETDDDEIPDVSFFSEDVVLPDGTGIDVIGAFLSFLLVLFVNQVHAGFAATYALCMKAKGNIVSVATVAATVMPKETSLRLVRHLNAAHLVGYVGLSDTFTKANFFDGLNKDMKLLTGSELNRINVLMANGDGNAGAGVACWEILTWAMKDVQEATEAGIIDGRVASELRKMILEGHGAMAALYNDIDQPPISFFHFHLLSLLCCIYLPIFAITHAYLSNTVTDNFTISDIFQFLVVFLQACFVIGLRKLALVNMDPFGEDIEDLSVMTFVMSAFKTSNQIIDVEFLEKESGENEEARRWGSVFGKGLWVGMR